MSYEPQQQVPPQQGYPQQQPLAQYSNQPPGPGGAPTFDVGNFWRGLGLQSQVAGIASLILFISLFLPWFSVSYSCSGAFCGTISSAGGSANAWSSTNGGGLGGATGFGFTLLWLVILAAFVLLALQVIIYLRKLNAQQGQLFIILTAGVALLCEVIYMFTAFGAVKGSSFSGNGFSESLSAGPGFGFWLGLLATIAAGGVYVYFTYIKKQTPQYPGQ